MPETNIWLGTSVASIKVVKVTPGPNVLIADPPPEFILGLTNAQFTFNGWDAEAIVAVWNSSEDAAISAITASTNDEGEYVLLTANDPGEDFEVICSIPGTISNSSSTYQTLSISPKPSGGTFTITINGQTTGAITYSATPATFRANIQAGINALSGYAPTDVVVAILPESPDTFLFDFSHGQFLGLNVALITATHTSFTGGDAEVVVTVIQAGSTSTVGTSQVDTLSFPIDGEHEETVSAIQTLNSTAYNGTFTISIAGYGETIPISYLGSRTEIRLALETIMGEGNVLVTDGPLYYPATNTFHTVTVTFIGELVGIDIPVMTTDVISGEQSEVQLLEASGYISGGTFTLTYDGQTTSALAATASAGTIQTALIALSNLATDDVVLTGGPLVPGGAPADTDVDATAIIYTRGVGSGLGQYTDVNPYFVNIVNANPGTDVGSFLFSATSFGTVYTFKCWVAHDDTRVGNTMKVDIVDIDDSSSYYYYGGGHGVPVFGAIDISDVFTDLDGNDLIPVEVDITDLMDIIRARPGWRSGNVINLTVSGNQITDRYYIITSLINPLTGNASDSQYLPVLTVTAPSGSSGPITMTFGGTLTNTDVDEMTVNPASLTGVDPDIIVSTVVDGSDPAYTPTELQEGGTVMIENINGGTFTLIVKGTIISGLAYNTTATALKNAINAVFGSTVCNATGGPAPGTPIQITFTGALELQPITVIFLSSLETNIAGSVTKTVIQAAVAPYASTNVWNLDICPGRGTLGIEPAALIRLKLSVSTESGTMLATVTPLGNMLLLMATLDAHIIESAINEVLSADACRVSQINHSLEHAEVLPSTSNEYVRFWYMRDTYQIVFSSNFTSVDVTVELPTEFNTTDKFMVYTVGATNLPDSGDTLDSYPEDKRVAIGFVSLATSAPIHIFQANKTVGTRPANTMSWRYKLLPQYKSSLTNHVGIAIPLAGKIYFSWVKRTISNTGVISVQSPIVASDLIDWDSPTELVKKTIEEMFFGVGNVDVTGSLHNSWLSEALAEAPPPVFYQDLRVKLTGVYANMPLDDYGYTLTCTITDQAFTVADEAFQKSYQLYGDFITRTIPPHFNLRNRVTVSSPENVEIITIGACSLLVDVSPTITAAELQAELDALFPEFVASAIAGQLPAKLRHPIYVYGTSFVDGPMEFEFTSGGSQQNEGVVLIVSAVPSGVTIGLITVDTAGVLGVPEVDPLQSVNIEGEPYGGTFTLTFGGNTTAALAYNVSLATLTSAVTTADFDSPTITGNSTNGFTFTWDGADGPRAAITAADSLNNAGKDLLVTMTHEGGLNSTFIVNEITRGRGPNYLDDAGNWSLSRTLNTTDIPVFDDCPIPVKFGLDLSSIIHIESLGTDQITLFSHERYRQVYDDDQTVVLYSGSVGAVAPGSMAFGTTYVVDQAAAVSVNTFTLKGLDGTPVKATSPGSGSFILAVSNLAVKIYSRFSGGQIGLPHVRAEQKVVESLNTYFRAMFDSITIGIDSGDGLALGNFDCMTSDVVITIEDTAIRSIDNIPPVVLLTNSEDAALQIKSGDVGIAVFAGETSEIGAVEILQGTLSISNSVVNSLVSTGGATVKLLNTTITEPTTIG